MIRRIAGPIVRLLEWFYARLYALLCGSFPNLRPWHFQWRALHATQGDLREVLPLLEGRVLVVGRTGLNHRALIAHAREFVVVDEAPGPGVTLVVNPGRPWPLPTAAFDALLCLDALATVADPAHGVAEMARLLRPGALAVVSAPAASVAALTAAAPLRYYTVDGLRKAMSGLLTVTTVRCEGGIGSALALLLLGWIQTWANANPLVRLLQFIFLPLWLAFCAALNLAAVVADAVDPTRAFYPRVLIVAVRTPGQPLPPTEP